MPYEPARGALSDGVFRLKLTKEKRQSLRDRIASMKEECPPVGLYLPGLGSIEIRLDFALVEKLAVKACERVSGTALEGGIGVHLLKWGRR
jgi:hypothetical protein